MRTTTAGLLAAAAALVAGCQASTPRAAPTAAPSTSPPASPTATPSASPTASASPSPRVVPTTPAPSRTAAPAFPPYAWSSRRVTAADLPHTWHAGCPVGPAQLRLLTLRYVGWDGSSRTGQVVVNASAVGVVSRAFGQLYAQRFPIRSLRLADAYGGDDDASMAADNTSGFNCRAVPGTTVWSEHAYGLAVDVNPLENPFLPGDGTVQPPAGRAYLDRAVHRRGMALAGGVLVQAFTAQGWKWGGLWNHPDYQHFSWNGR